MDVGEQASGKQQGSHVGSCDAGAWDVEIVVGMLGRGVRQKGHVRVVPGMT